ncbi:hypothetical protein [aff. Roholtiella sp. LEGE 12411]|uniref:hypothetical protein n=1 Tax=aff. Roholtiella sp. LEGE 12411 TaxID=1828822 RepID=UPI0018814686|nr:hypothetical protein [aff. Roholtiella sp. LEGE 12411]MBE9035800.1 hypothetical protein [aff. Roholtiella sp. LEGE 12411]
MIKTARLPGLLFLQTKLLELLQTSKKESNFLEKSDVCLEKYRDARQLATASLPDAARTLTAQTALRARRFRR